MDGSQHVALPRVRLVGEVPVKLWGLKLEEWQSRTWKKLGADGVAADGRFCVGSDWIVSPALAKSLLARPGAVLIVKDTPDQERIAIVHSDAIGAETHAALVNAINPNWDELKKAGLEPGYMNDFVGDYDKALRKREALS